MKIVVVGMGIMGSAVSHCLTDKGIDVISLSYRALRSNARREVKPHLQAATHLLTFLADEVASNDFWLNDFAAIDLLEPNTVCIECSTVPPDFIDTWSKRLLTQRLVPIECPVTGSKPKARSGELTLFLTQPPMHCNGTTDPVLRLISTSVFRFEDFGEASRYKSLYNTANFFILCALGCFVRHLQTSGFSNDQISELLTRDKSWLTPVIGSKLPRILESNYSSPDFKLETMLKDIRARAQMLPSMTKAEQLFMDELISSVSRRGDPLLDFSCVADTLLANNRRAKPSR